MSPKTLIFLVIRFISLGFLITFGAEQAIASSPSNETDRASLLSFKLGITQDPLGIMKSWNDSLNFCQWRGVTCNLRQRVTTLDLNSSQLSGTLSPYIGNLSFLRRINLRDNFFHGEIPETFGQLSFLQVFSIGINNISGIVPPSLYNLSSVIVFSTASNQLRGSLPPNIGLTLPNLQQFGISDNQFSGKIPVSLANASGILRLDLSKNTFSGSVPGNLGNFQNLWWLNLGNNLLGSGGNSSDDLSFFSSLANCTNLQQLGLTDNRFGGSLPISLTNLSTQLTTLLMGRNFISGEIPEGIEIFTNLNELAMESNYFTGTIPTSLGMLSKLQILYLNKNKLSGPIPSTIGNLTQLYDLMLANNNLEGKIPSSLENCQQLQILRLFDNELDDSVPGQAIGQMRSLFHLNLSQNSLTGPLPVEIGNLQSLETLSISNNKLFGEIPSNLGNCLSLETIELEGNELQGTIPSSLSSLMAIKYLDLSRNHLSDRIPEYLENISLLFLNLSFNNFEAEVPIGGIFRNHSKFSVLGNRNLCGGIQELNLPSCPMNASSKGKMTLIIKIVIVIIGAFFIITILFSAFLWRRKSRSKSSISFSEGGFLRISYKDLLKATNGFSTENLIGVGSFGSVFKGVLEETEKPIAVKVLNLQQKGAAKTFLVECETLKEVRHRNLIKILSSCSSIDFKGNDFKALIFELMPNGSLDSWLHPTIDQERVLSLCQRLDIAIDVASALDYLHHHSHIAIVHSDLKPSNVLLGEDMAACVTDFGLAKFLKSSTTDNNQSRTEMSSVAMKGSIGYIAPEYGMGSEASMEGDVYSFGILLLEIITGKRPTNEMFKDGLCLRTLSEKALPDQVIRIADPQLLSGIINEEVPNEQNEMRFQECLNSLVRIGLTCSSDSPSDRMGIKDVLAEITALKQLFLGVGTHQRS